VQVIFASQLREEKIMKNMNLPAEELALPKKPDALYSAEKKAKRNNAEAYFKHFNDNELVSRFVETQDEGAFNEIVDRYGEKIYRTALRITRNATWAEDVLQEVLIKLVKRLETFNARAKFSTWVYRVTVNASFAHLRVEKKYREDLSLEECISKIEYRTFKGVDIENLVHITHDSFYQQELMEKIEQALDKLPASYRVVFHLRDVEGLTNPEMAKILSLSIATVKCRIHRARFYLRRKLSGYM
jgi:RNA polymerase sigma-70 factor, ECF subfamily